MLPFWILLCFFIIASPTYFVAALLGSDGLPIMPPADGKCPKDLVNFNCSSDIINGGIVYTTGKQQCNFAENACRYHIVYCSYVYNCDWVNLPVTKPRVYCDGQCNLECTDLTEVCVIVNGAICPTNMCYLWNHNCENRDRKSGALTLRYGSCPASYNGMICEPEKCQVLYPASKYLLNSLQAPAPE